MDEDTRSIARDTGWQFLAESARLVAGLTVFLLVARALGPSQFGVFVAIASVVSFVVPFANLGAPLLLMQRVRREQRDLIESWRTAMTMTVVGGGVATLAVVALLTLLLTEAPPAAVLGLSLGEFVFGATISLCAYAAMSDGQLRTAAIIVCADSAVRIGAAVFLLLLSVPTVTGWAIAECIGAVLTAAAVVGATARHHGTTIMFGRLGRGDVVAGLPYSAAIGAFSAQDGVDKPLLVYYGWSVDAGWYGAAYRIPSLAFLPVQALVVSTFNRSFSVGRLGIAAATRLARRLLAPSIAYALVAGLLIIVLGPAATPLLGPGFAGSLPMLRWLAVLPVLRTLQYFPANAITGAGYPRHRLALLIVVLVVNLVLCLVLIPGHSWRGAAIATLVAESFYAAGLWAMAAFLGHCEAAGRPVRGFTPLRDEPAAEDR